MKRILFVTTLAIAAIFTGTAQSTNPIKAKVSQQTYSEALARYNSGQPITADDALIVYYGAADQPGFNPSKTYPEINSTYTSGATDKAFKLCKKALASDPANLWLLFKTYASAAVSKDSAIKAKAPAIQNQILAVCDAIFNSAVGVSESAPYIVVRASDIDEFVNKYIQPESIIGRAKVGNVDAIKMVISEGQDPAILYFSIR